MSEREIWRVGRKVGRTVYQNDVLIGLMDTPELAAEVVAAVNGTSGEQPFQATAISAVAALVDARRERDEAMRGVHRQNARANKAEQQLAESRAALAVERDFMRAVDSVICGGGTLDSVGDICRQWSALATAPPEESTDA